MPHACVYPQQHARARQSTLILTPVHAEPGDVGPCISKFRTQPLPCPEDHVPHHPDATAKPWHQCDETRDLQQLSVSSGPLAETENPRPCHVLELLCLVELFFNASKNFPTTGNSRTTHQARHLSTTKLLIPLHHHITSNFQQQDPEHDHEQEDSKWEPYMQTY